MAQSTVTITHTPKLPEYMENWLEAVEAANQSRYEQTELKEEEEADQTNRDLDPPVAQDQLVETDHTPPPIPLRQPSLLEEFPLDLPILAPLPEAEMPITPRAQEIPPVTETPPAPKRPRRDDVVTIHAKPVVLRLGGAVTQTSLVYPSPLWENLRKTEEEEGKGKGKGQGKGKGEEEEESDDDIIELTTTTPENVLVGKWCRELWKWERDNRQRLAWEEFDDRVHVQRRKRDYTETVLLETRQSTRRAKELLDDELRRGRRRMLYCGNSVTSAIDCA